jgi:hypothetical protein
MKRGLMVLSCLFFVIGGYTQDWAKIKLGNKITVYFPQQPSVENTPVGPQAQYMDNDSTRYTVLIMDLSKDGIDSATLNAQMRDGFEEFAKEIAVQGGVNVSRVAKSTWQSNYPVAEVSGRNDTRDVELRMILMGSEIVIIAYSSLPEKNLANNKTKFFQSIAYTYNPLRMVSKETRK